MGSARTVPHGGELLRVDGRSERVGHLSALPMPGAMPQREPWRMAASVAHQLGAGDRIAGRFSASRRRPCWRACSTNRTCVPHRPASAGLDAAAGLLGVCEVMSYEGEAAMRLESLSSRYGPPWPFRWMAGRFSMQVESISI